MKVVPAGRTCSTKAAASGVPPVDSLRARSWTSASLVRPARAQARRVRQRPARPARGASIREVSRLRARRARGGNSPCPVRRTALPVQLVPIHFRTALPAAHSVLQGESRCSQEDCNALSVQRVQLNHHLDKRRATVAVREPTNLQGAKRSVIYARQGGIKMQLHPKTALPVQWVVLKVHLGRQAVSSVLLAKCNPKPRLWGVNIARPASTSHRQGRQAATFAPKQSIKMLLLPSNVSNAPLDDTTIRVVRHFATIVLMDVRRPPATSAASSRPKGTSTTRRRMNTFRAARMLTKASLARAPE